MDNTEFTQNILNAINNQVSKLTPEFIIDGAELTTIEEINQRFGSFADFKVFAKSIIAKEPNASDSPSSEEPNANESLENATVEEQTKKTVIVTDHAGVSRKVTCPGAATLKQILKAIGIDTEEGFEIRVNGSKEIDPYSVPENGSIITALREIKGNQA